MISPAGSPANDKNLPILVKGKVNGFGQGIKGPYAYVRIITYHDWQKSLQPDGRRLTRDITISLEWPVYSGPDLKIGDLLLITCLTKVAPGTNRFGQVMERWQGNLARPWTEDDDRFFDLTRPKDWPDFPGQPQPTEWFGSSVEPELIIEEPAPIVDPETIVKRTDSIVKPVKRWSNFWQQLFNFLQFWRRL